MFVALVSLIFQSLHVKFPFLSIQRKEKVKGKQLQHFGAAQLKKHTASWKNPSPVWTKISMACVDSFSLLCVLHLHSCVSPLCCCTALLQSGVCRCVCEEICWYFNAAWWPLCLGLGVFHWSSSPHFSFCRNSSHQHLCDLSSAPRLQPVWFCSILNKVDSQSVTLPFVCLQGKRSGQSGRKAKAMKNEGLPVRLLKSTKVGK